MYEWWYPISRILVLWWWISVTFIVIWERWREKESSGFLGIAGFSLKSITQWISLSSPQLTQVKTVSPSLTTSSRTLVHQSPWCCLHCPTLLLRDHRSAFSTPHSVSLSYLTHLSTFRSLGIASLLILLLSKCLLCFSLS